MINSDINNFSQKENEINNLKNQININFINNINYDLIINTDINKNTYDIVELLKNNPDMNSYKDIIDYLTFEDLLKMFSFILNNKMAFISNPQSYLIIDKVISVYNKNNNSINKIKENIFHFFYLFFQKI